MTPGQTVRVPLLVEYRRGSAVREEVEAQLQADGIYELLHSPAFVPGVAAGDRVRLLDARGAFHVVRRSGNVAVQVFYWIEREVVAAALTQLLPSFAGRLDGESDHVLVVTAPPFIDRGRISAAMRALHERVGGIEWYIGSELSDARP